jgi:haloacetate dehalogenase
MPSTSSGWYGYKGWGENGAAEKRRNRVQANVRTFLCVDDRQSPIARPEMPQFAECTIDTGEAHIFAAYGGTGPPLVLLHGFPETHLMWRGVAPRLVDSFTVVMMDLRGYGRSSCPISDDRHSPYGKRCLARDVVAVMGELGYSRFGVAGHDRGGRVAYRLALDHPDRIDRLAVLDIVAGKDAWGRADARLALSFWPWSLLAQPAPLPERILERTADVVIEDAASQWGTPSSAFPDEVRAAYAAALAAADHAHAICEEYRAGATIDREHDAADLAARRKISCPTLVLWAANGALETWYAEEGGPLQIWRQWCDNVGGQAIEGGHFFPEANPRETADRLRMLLP